jgi:small subunit ribosomal protein S16
LVGSKFFTTFAALKNQNLNRRRVLQPKLKNKAMPLKLRLARRGRKKQALFDIVASDSRSPRDGKFIEKVGVYNPNTNPATIELAEAKTLQWLLDGAQPTDTVRRILSYKGLLLKKHLQVGVNKGAISQEEADKKLASWIDSKTTKIEDKKSTLANKKAAEAKSKFAAEEKVNAARAEAVAKKNIVVEETLVEQVEAVAETPAAEVVDAPVAETVVAAVVEETPVVEAAPVVEATETPVAEAPTEEKAAE